MIHVGIDPGLHGAVAMVEVSDSGEISTDVWDTPTYMTESSAGKRTHQDTERCVELLKTIMSRGMTQATLEALHAMPKNGSIGCFRLGHSLGKWEGMLWALGIPFKLVPSQTWKRAVLGKGKKEKNDSRLKAMELYPKMYEKFKRVMDDGRAEALLMAHHGYLAWGEMF